MISLIFPGFFSFLRIGDRLDADDAVTLFDAHEDDALGIAAVEVDAGGRSTQHDAAGLDEHDVVRIIDDGRACDKAGLLGQAVVAQALAAARRLCSCSHGNKDCGAESPRSPPS